MKRFDKHKKRATLGMGEYPPVMNCALFAVHKALKYEWVIIPYHLMLYTNKEWQNSCTGSSDLIASSKCIFVWIRNMFGEVELFISPWCGCSVPRRKRKTKYCLPIDAGNV